MNAKRLGLLLLTVWPLAPWGAAAKAADPPTAGQTAMAEDIEIMRQMLIKRLHVPSNLFSSVSAK